MIGPNVRRCTEPVVLRRDEVAELHCDEGFVAMQHKRDLGFPEHKDARNARQHEGSSGCSQAKGL